ncbi:hypothetical protein BDW22DRAFT_1355069 [Trametopsis cervina]|nr:hypothetical protein BDW22DRAFT_1355069 [Trametopsis cervina]
MALSHCLTCLLAKEARNWFGGTTRGSFDYSVRSSDKTDAYQAHKDNEGQGDAQQTVL